MRIYNDNKDPSQKTIQSCSYCRDPEHNATDCPHVAGDWASFQRFEIPSIDPANWKTIQSQKRKGKTGITRQTKQHGSNHQAAGLNGMQSAKKHTKSKSKPQSVQRTPQQAKPVANPSADSVAVYTTIAVTASKWMRSLPRQSQPIENGASSFMPPLSVV